MAIDKTQSFFIDEKYKREVETKIPYNKILANTGIILENENNITIIGRDDNGNYSFFKNENPDTKNEQITIIAREGSVDNIHLINESGIYYNEKTLSPQVKIFYFIPEMDTSS